MIAAEAAGLAFWDWDLSEKGLHWDDLMFRCYGLQATIAGGPAFDTAFRVNWPDGQVRWLKSFASVIYDRDGAAQRVVGVSFDITERKESEQVDSSVATRFGGTGLGLSICKQLAELMGGTIVIRDRIGGWQQFCVCNRMSRGDGWLGGDLSGQLQNACQTGDCAQRAKRCGSRRYWRDGCHILDAGGESLIMLPLPYAKAEAPSS